MPRQLITLSTSAPHEYRVNAEMFGPLGVHPELIYDADSPYGTGYIFHKKRWQITHRNGRIMIIGIESAIAARAVAIACNALAPDLAEIDTMMDEHGKLFDEHSARYKEIIEPLMPFIKELRFSGIIGS